VALSSKLFDKDVINLIRGRNLTLVFTPADKEQIGENKFNIIIINLIVDLWARALRIP